MPSTHTATSNHECQEDTHVIAAQEMRNKFQRVTIKSMIEMFPDVPGMPPVNHSCLAGLVARTKRGGDYYNPWITAMTPYLASDWEMVNSSNSPDNDTSAIFGATAIKPSISGYSKDSGRVKLCDATRLKFSVEFKMHKTDDFSTRKKPPFELPSNHASNTRGQLTLYHNAIQASQQRTRVFSCYIRRSFCRLMCHSRAGTYVTPLFNYTKTSHLHRFLWRLSHATDEKGGIDTTFKPIVDHSSVPDDVFTKLNIPKESPLYNVAVTDSASKVSEFYVSEPFTASHKYPVGRGTRCFSAYDLVSKKVVLLKDIWRVATYTPEGEIYERLNQAQVPNIPGVITHGDVPGDLQTCEIVAPDGPQRKLIHYRIVLDVIGKPLSAFSSTYELVTAVRDATIAHRDAWEKAQVLHRDVSFGNIIIVNGRGMLIDWEMAKLRETQDLRQRERTGTWQFMSLRLLQLTEEDPKDHRVSDDIESFMHVLFWVTARYALNKMTNDDRGEFLHQFDYNATNPVSQKRKFILLHTSISDIRLSTEPLANILEKLIQTLYHFYDEDNLALKAQLRKLRIPDGFQPSMFSNADHQRQAMNSHTWMLNTLTDALQNDDWKSMNDRAVNHHVGQLLAARPKRKRKPESELELAKRRRINQDQEHEDVIEDQMREEDEEDEEDEERDEFLDETGNEDDY